MWGPVCLLWMFTWTVFGAPSISTVCPEYCECSTLKDGLKAHCSSIDFLGKLRPKQIQEITELNVSELSLRTIDHKLRKLKNLIKLNLSGNNIEDLKNFPHLPHLTHLYLSHNSIKQFTAYDLPKSLKHLDLSSNRIVNITDISKLLPNLREINLNDNLLSCECDFLKYRDLLQLNDVHIVRPANCYTPENVRGNSMLSVYCAFGKVVYDDLEHMLRDEPGSGEDIGAIAAASTSSDILDFDTTERDGVKDDDEMENEYFRTNIDSNSSATESEEDSLEGSGSVIFDVRGGGSGDGDFIPVSPDPAIPHCYYNCSTPSPDQDTNSSAPPVSIGQEISRLFNELTGKVTETTTTTTITPSPSTKAPVQEEEVQQKSAATLSKTVPKEGPEPVQDNSDKSRITVDVPKESQTTEDVSKRNNTTTYVIVAVLFLAMVALIAYVVVKKRKNRNNNNRRPSSNHDVKEPPPVEMKPLMTDPAPIKPNIAPEATPLMNGQNGTSKKSEAEEPLNDETDGKAPVENGIDIPEAEEPQIRPKKEDEVLLTPSTKRVTIQAKELSSPKSPVLVHRHLGDDGKIVSSPVSNNEFKYT